jgi:hypothetical protein
MIVRANKGFETNSLYPKTDWYKDGHTIYVVDETTPEGMELAQKIARSYPYYDFVTDSEGNLIDITEYPPIQYSINKTTITAAEITSITITDPATVTAIIGGEEYKVTDGEIEYSNENVGTHIITLKTEGYRDAVIEIEVVEA